MRKPIILFASIGAFIFNAHAQIITTIAGNGIGAYNGDGIQATAAELNQPTGVVVDKAGNIYIADNVNHRVRKIDAITGKIQTIAGTGFQGYNGDGIQATAADLYQPWMVALDTNGNVYIADWGNSRIRKVTISTGIISTLAGTGAYGYNGDGIQATAAMLNYTGGVSVAVSGEVYFSDVNNHRVRKIDNSGIISTIAGTGIAGYNGDGIQATAAQLHNPSKVCLDPSNNVYIADYYNNEIRKVTVSTGIISSVAGNGTGAYSGDGGQATAAEIHNPTGLFLDATGNIYISDYSNQRIREVDASSGIITTVAGNGTAGYFGDGGQATAAEINYPWDVTVTSTAYYIAEQLGYRVRKVTIPSQVNNLCNFWTQKASLTALNGREDATGFSIGHYGFIGTGNTSSGFVNDFWKWNQTNNTWTSIANYAGAGRYGITSFTIGGKGYACLGWTGSSNANDLWVYDTATNVWIQKANFPGNARYGAFVFVLGTKAYVGCGEPNGAPYYQDVWMYNSVTDTWTQVANFPGGNRTSLCSFALNGSGYAGCGWDYSSVHNDMYRYDSANNTWTSVASLPISGGLTGPISFVIDSLAYVGTGDNQSIAKLSRDFWSYSSTTNTWTPIATLTGVSRWAGVGFAIGNKGYAATGYDSVNNYLTDYWEYYPCTDTIPLSANIISNNNNHSVNLFPNPNNGRFTIELSGVNDKPSVKIYNMLGEQIYSAKLKSSNTQIELSNNTAGIYLYRVITERNDLISEGKFIIQK